MKEKTALCAIQVCLLLNVFGIIALFWWSWPPHDGGLMILYMLLAALVACPLFLLIRGWAPTGIWQSTAEDQTPFEQRFIRLYNRNMLLVRVVWIGVVLLVLLK